MKCPLEERERHKKGRTDLFPFYFVLTSFLAAEVTCVIYFGQAPPPCMDRLPFFLDLHSASGHLLQTDRLGLTGEREFRRGLFPGEDGGEEASP